MELSMPKSKSPAAKTPELAIEPTEGAKNDIEVRARAFLAQATHFQLGHLPTESRHPKTTRLSQLAIDGDGRGDTRGGLLQAIELLKEVELDALAAIGPRLPKINEMKADILATLNEGHRVYLCGCGATGRLSLSLETLWREECAQRRSPRAENWENRVISFMAGGDYAMVRSIENFEDHPEYGARQLHDLGFTKDDLLIGTTEGGETPWVIGAVEEAAKVSRRKPYMLFCNPADVLAKTVERSRRVIESKNIHSIAIETGPMALAGSTRLQATTILMLSTGAALFSCLDSRPGHQTPQAFINEFIGALNSADLSGLAPLIERETEVYRNNGVCLHETAHHAITVLTDTTERSPTFSLLPFENVADATAPLAWTYLITPSSKDSAEAWQKVLGRAPRALPWPGFAERFGEASLAGFDFSPASAERRSRKAQSTAREITRYQIERAGSHHLALRIDDAETMIPRPESLLCEHLMLKIAMNISSTLTMGRLGRFSGNLMLYVRAANNKLVDRAIRYIRILLADANIRDFTYDDVCLALFAVTAEISVEEPAVWKTFEHLKARASGSSRVQ